MEVESTIVELNGTELAQTTKTQGKLRGSLEAPWQLYFDGASVMSSSYAGSGAVLKDQDHRILDEFARFIGPQTMNVAEYVGLLGGLRLALDWNVDHLCCYGDSPVVHNQVKGSWRTRRFKMAFLCFHAQELLKLFKSVKLVFINRKKNMHAARLAHEAINIQWDREALPRLDCENNNLRTKKSRNKNDADKYYEHSRNFKKK